MGRAACACAYPMKPSLANRSRVTINRAFEFLLEDWEFRPERGARASRPSFAAQGGEAMQWFPEGLCVHHHHGQACGSPASTLVWEAVGDPLCVKCRAGC